MIILFIPDLLYLRNLRNLRYLRALYFSQWLKKFSFNLFLLWFLLGKRQKGKKAKINQGKPYKHGSQRRNRCK